MKRLFIITVCSTLLFACGNSCKKAENASCSYKTNAQTAIQQESHSTKLTTESFKNKIADISQKEWKYVGDRPAIIDFYADWCAPCRIIAPTIEELAKRYNGELYIYKVNIDDAPELAEKFRISAIPTIMFVPMQGEPITERGIISMDGFEKYIKEYLLK